MIRQDLITINLSILSFNSSLVSNDTLLLCPSLTLINELEEDHLVDCLSNFTLVNILLAVSTVCLRSSMGKQYPI